MSKYLRLCKHGRKYTRPVWSQRHATAADHAMGQKHATSKHTGVCGIITRGLACIGIQYSPHDSTCMCESEMDCSTSIECSYLAGGSLLFCSTRTSLFAFLPLSSSTFHRQSTQSTIFSINGGPVNILHVVSCDRLDPMFAVVE